MNRSMATNRFTLGNNCNLRDAYTNQLFNQPSLTERVREHLENENLLDSQDERVDDDEMEVDFDPAPPPPFNPFLEPTPGDDSRDDDSTLPVKFLNKRQRFQDMKKKLPDNLPTPESYVYTNSMSAQATAYVELLQICQKHGASKTMFDEIATWATEWTEKDPNVFKVKNKAQKWTRAKTLKHIKQVFGLNGLSPKNITVELHDKRKVSVPVVDFAESMRSILNDDEVMKCIMKGLDPVTWRPVVDEQTHEKNTDAFIDDKDSGYLYIYRQGIDLHCPNESECDAIKIRPFPVIIHIDKSHSDLFGNLAVAPIQVMPAMIDVNAKQKIGSWRSIATIPNLSAGKGKDGKKSKDPFKKLCDYHKVMSVALSSFVKCYEDGGFMWHDKSTGTDVLLKPYVHCFVGDIAGINEMIGHYNNNSANCLVKDCKCNQDKILEFEPNCSPIKWTDLQACDTAKEVFDM
jgi:hypothetical protein